MIDTLAKKITTKFIDHKIIKSDEREIYNYCFETTIVILLSYSLLFILSMIFNEFMSTLIFILSFSSFRKVCGGYHADNYLKCGIMSLASYLFLIFIIKKLNIIFEVSTLTLVLGALTIMFLSPIQDDNKPFTDKQYKRFKIISKGLAAILIIVFVIIEALGLHKSIINKYYFSLCYGIDLIAFSLLISKIERRIKNAKV
jgi:accessory gene regulator B